MDRRRVKEIVRAYFAVILLIAFGAALAGYYWYLHRKPFTQNAFLLANTRPVSPLVEGYLTDVFVRNGQKVRKGEPLFTVFRPPYEWRVRELRHAVAAEEARLAALDSRLRSAGARVVKARAESENCAFLSRQAEEMYAQQAISLTYAEERRRAMQSAAAELAAAENTEEEIRCERRAAAAGVEQLRSRLELALIDLEQTTVYALADGMIVNMHVSCGGYYRPGDTLFAFIETGEWWVQANFEETDLSRIRPGMRASVWLWQYPGKRFSGVVEAASWGAERRRISPVNGVQEVAGENQWFLLPQRMPMQIRILDPDPEHPFSLGASAFVQVDTSSRLWEQLLWRVFRWR